MDLVQIPGYSSWGNGQPLREFTTFFHVENSSIRKRNELKKLLTIDEWLR